MFSFTCNLARLLFCTLTFSQNGDYCSGSSRELLTSNDWTKSAFIAKNIQTNTVKFDIDLTTADINPVGAGLRKAVLVNGTFVGPTLHLTVGDNVEFLVRNYLREDTTIHFHGISQSKSPWSDGTPGLSQQGIRPGASYLYKWQAEDSGVYFYHAHNRGQIMDGLYGAIIISASPEAQRPFHLISDDPNDHKAMRTAEQSLQPLLISDWTQFTFKKFYEVEETANIDFTCMDAIIVNGAGSQYCLDRHSLDEFTNPLVKHILQATNETGITDKGCVPPLQLFQGDYDLHLDTVPNTAYRECVGGVGENGNYTVDVNSKDGWAALTFINPGGLYPLRVTIDNHPLYVYAIDGQYIEPQVVDQVLVNNGNRISVFIKLNQKPGVYKIRLANDLLGQVLGGFAHLSYDGSVDVAPDATPLMDYSGRPLNDTLRKFDEKSGRSYPNVRPAMTADRTRKFLVRKLGRPYGAYEWSLSGHRGYNMSEETRNSPTLFKDPSHIPSSELVLKTQKGEWVDLILEVEGPFAQAHPMHKHGNKAFVLGAGVGAFPWETVAEAEKDLPPGTFNFNDPPYRDSFNTIEGVNSNTWLALRYKADNPGAWLFHCHIQTHLAGGMGIMILDGVDDWPIVPVEYRERNGFDQAE